MVRNAFTLIELLIGITVIAMLTGILLPAVTEVRTAVNRVACTSNLRQVGIAMIAYASDYNDFLPAEGNCGVTDPARSPAWFVQLPPYYEQAKVQKQRSVVQGPNWRYQASGQFSQATPKSFKWNSRIDAAYGGRHYRLGHWADEASVLVMADAVAGESGMGQWGHLCPTGLDGSRHRGRVNWLALDGHSLSNTVLRAAPAADVDFKWCSAN
jgi:prepilin-type N-terminal cleavage/methylation domain-containing protein/prepilin-type processing-associated H-X9-DG protein